MSPGRSMPPFLKVRWNEDRGDAFAEWGASWWYFEIGPHRWARRPIEACDSGVVLKYDEGHLWDHHGGLAEKAFDACDSDMACQEISRHEFEELWQRAKALNRGD